MSHNDHVSAEDFRSLLLSAAITPPDVPKKRKSKILIIYTGGTFGMALQENGAFKPSTELFEKWFHSVPEFNQEDFPEIFVEFSEHIRDSSDMGPKDWINIGQIVSDNYEKADGFVVIHGTDTMSWSASALSFLLENLSKSVVLTGSQIPLSILRSDAKTNLLDAILVAAHSKIPEVLVVFNGSIMRGNRTVKRSAWEFNAFTSFNYPCLGVGGIQLTIDKQRIRKTPNEPFTFRPLLCQDVVLFRLFPNTAAADMFALVLEHQPNLKGIVLEAFGTGNIPAWPKLVETITEFSSKRQIFILVVSMCVSGTVMLEIYQNGLLLKNAGAVSGLDMTTEAAYCKLSYLLGLMEHERAQKGEKDVEIDRNRLLSLLKTDLRGELTVVDVSSHEEEQEFIY